MPPQIGWDTVLSRSYEGGVDLSGGQWQRIALARALFAVRHGAPILVLDEPTAWLDARGEADFFDRFLEITHGTTSLIISHRFSTVRRAQHICVLEGGRSSSRAITSRLIAAGNRYAELFRLQAARYRGGVVTPSRSWRTRVAARLARIADDGSSIRRCCWSPRAIASVLYPLGIALVINAALRHQSGRVELGVALLAGPLHVELGDWDARRYRRLATVGSHHDLPDRTDRRAC